MNNDDNAPMEQTNDVVEMANTADATNENTNNEDTAEDKAMEAVGTVLAAGAAVVSDAVETATEVVDTALGADEEQGDDTPADGGDGPETEEE